ncbi:hypothetical protein E4T49_04091 [Aureobasidium sp. EXF-10728]|nr:hypothetical protein E4T49_04091 [Aureobasidium sp. EXF-10728]
MASLTDTGHHNCRDYYHPLPLPATTHTLPPALSMTQTTASILRLHSTQKSPLNHKPNNPSFPFLRLPYELRAKIYAYLLPYTETMASAGTLISVSSNTSNAASSAHRIHLAGLPSAKYSANTTLWHRGNTALLAVCKLLHSECAALLYGNNVFVLWVSYDNIQFRFRWVLASGLAPSGAFDFLQLVKGRYLGLVRRLVVTVDVVDEYTGMIKYNVGGSGLVHGLKLQVAKLVTAFKDAEQEEGIKRLTLRLQNGNEGVPEGEKRGIGKTREREVRSIEEVQGVLEPLKQLTGLRELVLCGAITDAYKADLLKSMTATSGGG